ncbi:glycosyltransferase family 2 protein [Neurospora crassa]|uniref:Chitin synthase 4 n=1 Tax=Neurospora crassa (strain ATCC 24698 / 74-OR23-1A / CBS 708.71 / DSM 1257 / FGSC 987) TaxID=367110 RepID=CHS4_NEUCR|nr:chitin synthase 4, variant [Neurospora crassa OR74A]XP_011393275.1 chitin synthase 4 [Neurospora crassa OR74A]Q01285.3 RecName: Full=Chitin synthase 4; AltName: Full=Chitin-UDP acetyl-glucosaminyl transferase 4; AltName: Full=Class-IV chitin synthase 4 [Neurospora crassa OR74A]KHE83260.1 glycosyltransferase family 2 protein [Neurospora crassa]ESA44002.1 chitin synthase 4 [Neurospora crassa OR74A]ESA44003.1 chitin synthase 4, variant [Neurospora crassa OR74A]|eukprot:XP_011393274.1 chitin synthase 4, variant [Neurospora crassa OR74A]
MSLPRRPGPSPPHEEPRRYRQSGSRRSRPPPADVETGYAPMAGERPSQQQRVPSISSFPETLPSPNPNVERDPLAPTPEPAHPSGIPQRKRSLIRPERNRIGKDHPNYHYRKHAANMNTLPSSTGHDPIYEDLEGATDDVSGTGSRNDDDVSEESPPRRKHSTKMQVIETEKSGDERRRRRKSDTTKHGKIVKASKGKREKSGGLPTPSFWNIYCGFVTFWCPGFVLKCFGMPEMAQQRAWREKMGLISIILLIMGFVGFITFGFTQVVCGKPPLRLRINEVGSGYMIFHGSAYDLTKSHHPPAEGIPRRPDGLGANVIYDLPQHYGGQDGSFLFQNVNGKCKGLITKQENSDVPSDKSGNLAWYFPCNTFNQDGSSKPNTTIPYYLGYACHTTANARDSFYLGLKSSADVYFTWDDIKNSSRNLVVYSGHVLDLDLLHWFNDTQVTYPARFKELRDKNTAGNQAIRGRDITHAFQSSKDKQIAECFEEIIKVGSVDTETVGCIASKVVLYVSLVLILAVVLARFVLALIFQWFISKTYAAAKTSQTSDQRKRNRQIEDWTEDIYRAPPRLPGEVGSSVAGSSDRQSKRSSAFLPTHSRFSTVYGNERGNRKPGLPTTMASQNAAGQLLHPGTIYGQGNESRSSFLKSDAYGSSSSPADGPGPAGFIHEAVVPQPPSDWMPFGFPLAHTICLVTAYSEGEMGVRTTLDSIAMTDYPNSHKVILVICDGIIKGHGEEHSTPDIILGMMKDHTIHPDDVEPFSYVAVATGSKRHNMAKVYTGFYDYGTNSAIPLEKQQRVPMMMVVKCGTPAEASKSKPGNRGKRDSQIILMSFLQKVMFDERMTELEYEMFNGLWKITGISPDFYEIVLMVDADTKVFPDSLTHMISAMVKDPEIMGLCGETKIANKRASWVSAIQVFEYFVSHHLAKAFESVFGGVTCLPGCFCMYRIKAPKGAQNYWVPILANPDVVEHYSENVVDTLHKKNLLLLGEDRYLSTLMLRTFPKRKQVFVPQAVCKTTVPDEFMVLLSQRRRWINSTIHNLMELVLVRDLCGTFCFSMQFIVGIELIGTLVLPAAIAFTFYVVIISIINSPPQIIPLVLLGLILGLPAILVVVTAHSWSYIIWMFIYLLSLPVWNFVLPTYAFWKFDDFSWGDTRKTAGEKSSKGGHGEAEGEFDSSMITMKRWAEFERDRRVRSTYWAGSRDNVISGVGGSNGWGSSQPRGHEQGRHFDDYFSDA